MVYLCDRIKGVCSLGGVEADIEDAPWELAAD